VTDVELFAYGSINPVLAFALSFLGSLLSLVLARRSRVAQGRDRIRWLILAALSLGGTGIWLMHFMAMLGFDIPASPVRYDLGMTLVSFGIAVVIVAVGLFVAVYTKPNLIKIALGGIVTGLGVAAMHYTGMFAMRFAGAMEFDPRMVGLSIGIAVVASAVALWFAAVVRGASATVGAALLMACGCGWTKPTRSCTGLARSNCWSRSLCSPAS
jgi:NO-binding membrane sensor protein with MHYT domain